MLELVNMNEATKVRRTSVWVPGPCRRVKSIALDGNSHWIIQHNDEPFCLVCEQVVHEYADGQWRIKADPLAIHERSLG